MQRRRETISADCGDRQRGMIYCLSDRVYQTIRSPLAFLPAPRPAQHQCIIYTPAFSASRRIHICSHGRVARQQRSRRSPVCGSAPADSPHGVRGCPPEGEEDTEFEAAMVVGQLRPQRSCSTRSGSRMHIRSLPRRQRSRTAGRGSCGAEVAVTAMQR